MLLIKCFFLIVFSAWRNADTVEYSIFSFFNVAGNLDAVPEGYTCTVARRRTSLPKTGAVFNELQQAKLIKCGSGSLSTLGLIWDANSMIFPPKFLKV